MCLQTTEEVQSDDADRNVNSSTAHERSAPNNTAVRSQYTDSPSMLRIEQPKMK